MEEFLYKLIIIVIIITILCGCWYMTPWGRAMINGVDYLNHKVDEATNYGLKKEVEDTCRAMISSYTSDTLTWRQYRDSESEEQCSWADQAKMRANKTASSYNNYILRNGFVWEGNVPNDIASELPYLD